jgi:hypothetical protein
VFLSIVIQGVYFTRPAQRGLPLDDGWIHATYARNLARHHQLCLNPGEPSSGTTSFLWTVLLAGGQCVLDDPVVLPTLLNMMAQALLVVLVGLLVLEWTGDTLAALAASCSAALLGQLVWLSLTGMETTLFLALALGGIYFWSRGRLLAAGILMGLLALTRPEGLALPLAVALFELPSLRERPAPAARWAVLFAPVVVAFGLYVGINVALTGRPLTSTFLGRRWLAEQPEAVSLAPLALARQALTLAALWLRELHRWVFGSGLLRLLGFHVADTVAVAVGTALGLVALTGLQALWRTRQTSWRVVLLWALLHNGAYVVLLPVTGHAGRYQAINYVLLVVLVTVGAARLLRGAGGMRRLGVAAGMAWLVMCLSGTWLWGRIYRDCVDHIRDVHIACGKWIARALPEDAVVATFDLGAVAYFSERQVVDLGGLVDPEFARCLYAGDTRDYLHGRGVTHVAMVRRKPEGRYLAGRLGLLDTVPANPLKRWAADPDRYVLHHRATSNAMPIIVLYPFD